MAIDADDLDAQAARQTSRASAHRAPSSFPPWCR